MAVQPSESLQDFRLCHLTSLEPTRAGCLIRYLCHFLMASTNSGNKLSSLREGQEEGWSVPKARAPSDKSHGRFMGLQAS